MPGIQYLLRIKKEYQASWSLLQKALFFWKIADQMGVQLENTDKYHLVWFNLVNSVFMVRVEDDEECSLPVGYEALEFVECISAFLEMLNSDVVLLNARAFGYLKQGRQCL